MNTLKTLIGLLLFTLLSFPGCSQPVDTDDNSAENTANSTSTGSDTKPTPRMLPTPDQMADTSNQAIADESVAEETDGTTDENADQTDEEPVDFDEQETPSEIAAKSFAAPADSKAISKRNLWVDRNAGRVYADGYIAMNDGPLEMFACPSGTKEHESIIATLAKASELHAGLLAIGAQAGTPVTYNPSFIPATGQRIRIWVCYFDKDGKYQVTDARDWIVKTGTTESLKDDWVFAGSYVWTDPVDNHNYYQGDVGDMICVSNFTTAMLDIPVVSSADTDQLEYSPNTPRIPKRGTAVRLVLEPIPLPADGEETPDAAKPPTADVLQRQ